MDGARRDPDISSAASRQGPHCYALSLAPVTWVLISEIFPNRLRGIGVSISVSALWSASFLLTFTFPILNRVLGNAGTFWT